MPTSRPSSADRIEVLTAAQRPDLWERSRSLFTAVWPEYNMHGNHTGKYFGALYPKHARFQVLLYDASRDSIVGRGRTIPFRWDGTLEDLPAGIDALGLRAIDDPEPHTALSALAAEVAEDQQGRGFSGLIIKAMTEVARRAGLASLVAPVRPSWKDRYPLIPIDRYAQWVRDDGMPFDPWLRVHVRPGLRHSVSATVWAPIGNRTSGCCTTSDAAMCGDVNQRARRGVRRLGEAR